MNAFGDESGNFRNLLSGNEPYFTLAVAAGESTSCGACAARTIRLSESMKEAKWNDLTDVRSVDFSKLYRTEMSKLHTRLPSRVTSTGCVTASLCTKRVG